MRVDLPFLPVDDAEHKLFSTMMLKHKEDWDAMALDWCQYVDGKSIFPKLPVYLRTYHSTWTSNLGKRKATEIAQPALVYLDQMFKVTTSAPVPAPGPTAPTPPVPRAFSPPARPLPMPPAKTVDLEARESVVVGGNWIDYGTEDGSADSANDIGGAAKKKKGNGERGGDRKPRAKRSCSRCKHNKGANANDCNGRGAVARCQYFTEQNAPIPQTLIKKKRVSW